MAEIEMPPRGTRGSEPPGGALLQRLFKPITSMMVSRYRKNAGPTPPVMMGFPTVLLTTIGARTGKVHTHVLGGVAEDGDPWLAGASEGGAAPHPPWFLNLAKKTNPRALSGGKLQGKHVPPQAAGAV